MALPLLKDVRENFNGVDNKDDLEQVSELLVDFFHEIFSSIGLVDFI